MRQKTSHTRDVLLYASMVVMLAMATATTAQTADTTFVRSIEEVSVWAERTPLREMIPSQHLQGAELKRLNALNVADAVRFFSGVQIKDYGGVGGLKTVDIRSMGTNHVGVFYDGIQIGNAQNGTVDLGKFSMENMEEVAVYNGQKSDLLQPAKDFGNSGSIYLRTRRPSFQRDSTGNVSRRFNAKATMRTGSFGLVNPTVSFEALIGKHTSVAVNAEKTIANGRYKFRYHKVLQDANGHIVTAWDTTGTRQNGDIEAMRIEASFWGSTRHGNQWMAKGYAYDSERGIPRAIVRNVWTSSQRQWDRNIFCQASWHGMMGDNFEGKVGAKYARDHMRYLNPDTTLLYVDNTFTQHESYVTASGLYTFGPIVSMAIAQDWSHAWMTSNMNGFPAPTRNTWLTAAAVRLHGQRIELQGSLLLNIVADRAQDGSLPTGDHTHTTRKTTPTIMLNSHISDHWGLRAFAKRAFRMPTFNDLYYTDIGNIALRPETTSQLNAGATFTTLAPRGTSWDVQADIYHNKVQDKIVAIPKGNSQYRWMMMNIGKVDITGADVRCKTKFEIGNESDILLHATYTFQRAADHTDPSDNGPRGTYGGQISYTPRHSGSAIVQGHWRGASLCYSFIYVGERYHVSTNIPENYEPAWYTHDLALRYRHETRSTVKWQVALELNNVLNQQYDVVLNYPMPGRNFRLSASIEI